jgi:hypothetical protein
MTINWTRRDSAYACFGFCGAVVLAIEVSDFFDFDLAPLGWVPVVALFAALVLSAISWRHWPLLFLSVVSLIFAGIAVSDRVAPASSDLAAWIYGAIATLIPLWWFILGRRRMAPGTMRSAANT